MRTVNIHDFNFSVEPDPKDYWDWIEQGLYRAEIDTIKRFSGPDVTFIDVGAWVGAYALYASRLYKQVYAIEPDPVAFRILARNWCANKHGDVIIREQALMGHCGTTKMGGSILGCSCTRETCAENSVTVPCTTLREFCKDIPDPLFIKMDTEGAEAKILQDWEFFAERKPDLMLSTHLCWWKEGGSDGKAEYESISRVGKLYRTAIHNETRTPVNFSAEYGDVVFTDK